MTKKKRKTSKRKLTEAQKAFVVQCLACYDTPAETAAALKETYNVELSPQGCQAYDPTKFAGRNVAKKWRDMFESQRKAFLKDMEQNVPEANKAVRVRDLAKAARNFKRAGNYIAMADMLERIAKEVGNVHTNRRELTGRKGGPIEYRDVDSMSLEEVDNELLRRGIDPNVHAAPVTTQ